MKHDRSCDSASRTSSCGATVSTSDWRTVVIDGLKFQPETLTVRRGDTVV